MVPLVWKLPDLQVNQLGPADVSLLLGGAGRVLIFLFLMATCRGCTPVGCVADM